MEKFRIAELEEQVKLVMQTVHLRDAQLRTYRARLEDAEVVIRTLEKENKELREIINTLDDSSNYT